MHMQAEKKKQTKNELRTTAKNHINNDDADVHTESGRGRGEGRCPKGDFEWGGGRRVRV